MLLLEIRENLNNAKFEQMSYKSSLKRLESMKATMHPDNYNGQKDDLKLDLKEAQKQIAKYEKMEKEGVAKLKRIKKKINTTMFDSFDSFSNSYENKGFKLVGKMGEPGDYRIAVENKTYYIKLKVMIWPHNGKATIYQYEVYKKEKGE